MTDDLAPGVSWLDVAEQARTMGFDDFADLLDAADGATLRRAIDRMERTKAEDVRKMESLDKQRRRRLLLGAFRQWREEEKEGRSSLFATAGFARMIMQSAPRPDSYRPPLQRGNTLAVTHGANSPRLLAARMPEAHEELVEAVWADYQEAHPGGPPPRLDYLRMEPLVRTKSELDQYESYLDEVGELDASGHPRPAVAARDRKRESYLRQLDGLAIGPLPRARALADRASGARDAAVARRTAMREIASDYGRELRVVDAD